MKIRKIKPYKEPSSLTHRSSAWLENKIKNKINYIKDLHP
jgi:hypothetical protein